MEIQNLLSLIDDDDIVKEVNQYAKDVRYVSAAGVGSTVPGAARIRINGGVLVV